MSRARATRASSGHAATAQPSSASLLDSTALTNVNALDAQELEDLWFAIDTSSTTSGSDNDDDRHRAIQTVTRGMPPPNSYSNSSSSADAKSDYSSQHGSPSPSLSPTTTTATTTKRKPRTFTAAQVDQRRKRNRDSMRRVRQRKQVKVVHLRKQMELLQEKLEELRTVREQTNAAPASSHSTASATGTLLPTRPQRSNSDIQELLEGIKTLQFEQLCLHNAILNHQQVTASLVQIVNESKSLLAVPREHIFADGAFERPDEFQWVHAVLPLLPPLLSRASLDTIVRESYLAIVEHIRRADATVARANHVLGWHDKRVVSADGWATFHFSKDFAHEPIDALVAKTWAILTHTDQTNGFQSQGLHLKVLENVNDDTLVMARSAYAPLEDKYYSSIYVLLRIQTDDGGYVIGGRTISPLPEYEVRFQNALGPDRAYSHMCYGLRFGRTERLDDSDWSDQHRQVAVPLSGCHVQYGGRIGNGSTLMAQTWAMDVLLAALRWENACVRPLYRLAA